MDAECPQPSAGASRRLAEGQPNLLVVIIVIVVIVIVIGIVVILLVIKVV